METRSVPSQINKNTPLNTSVVPIFWIWRDESRLPHSLLLSHLAPIPMVLYILSVLNSYFSSQPETAPLHWNQLPLFEQAKAFTWCLSEVLMLAKLSCKETGEEKEQPFCRDASAPAGAITFHYSAAFFGNSPCLPLCHAQALDRNIANDSSCWHDIHPTSPGG